jgi:hypothetical protein
MATHKQSNRASGSGGKQIPAGVWNRGTKRGPYNPIRVRTKRLDEISGDKIALAYWLLAKQVVADGSDQPLDEAAVRRFADDLDGQDSYGGAAE